MATLMSKARGTGSASLLREPEFLKIWLAGGFANTVRWIEMLAIGVYVFDTTGSPFLVALLVVVRALPIFLFGSLAGAFAANRDRRRIYMAAISGILLVAVGLGTLGWLDRLPLWVIAAGAALSGLAWSTEHPVRRVLAGEIAGRERLGRAMAIESASNNATRLIGPLLGGLVYAAAGLVGAYCTGAVFLMISLSLLVLLRPRPVAGGGARGRFFTGLAEGFAHARRSRTVLGVLAISAIMNVFGFPYTAMIPVIGGDVMALGPTLVGALSSVEATGALLGSALGAVLLRPPWYGRAYLYGSAFFMAMVLVFSFVDGFVPGLFVLALGGFGAAGFAIMQGTLIMLAVPLEMRSRAMGLLAVSIGTGPLGILHLGLMADWLGAQRAVTVMTLEGLVLLLAAGLYFSELREPPRSPIGDEDEAPGGG